ncbi:hypothetical protein CYMTET_18695 [Cymbomonas tetramitiformis]|uniref:Uncharacterized protein n=1 Tax=Cymbomonas tetramitiformis TaxID=36881 RepID=A0AAE0G8X0_9CHLO|nr:hypothetical protein CYMTET_18695 [Cymbomonas tetramitiformis]
MAFRIGGGSEDHGPESKTFDDKCSKVMKHVITIAIQDALELAERYPRNPVHSVLLKDPKFLFILQEYKEKKHKRRMGRQQA